MSTPRLPAAERKKQILLSAIRVFARSTYHGATTKSIAEEAGVTEALLYRYFGSKRDIFLEGITHTASHLTKGLEKILAEKKEQPLRALLGCVDYIVTILENHRDLARMIFLVLAELDEEDVREVYIPYQERALAALQESIAGWKARGYVDQEVDAADAAWLFFGSYVLLAHVKQSEGAVELNTARVVGLVRPYLTEKGLRSLEDLGR